MFGNDNDSNHAFGTPLNSQSSAWRPAENDSCGNKTSTQETSGGQVIRQTTYGDGTTKTETSIFGF